MTPEPMHPRTLGTPADTELVPVWVQHSGRWLLQTTAHPPFAYKKLRWTCSNSSNTSCSASASNTRASLRITAINIWDGVCLTCRLDCYTLAHGTSLASTLQCCPSVPLVHHCWRICHFLALCHTPDLRMTQGCVATEEIEVRKGPQDGRYTWVAQSLKQRSNLWAFGVF